MTDATVEAESEYRLPAAYSQGFAHVRVVTNFSNPDSPGPLLVPNSATVAETPKIGEAVEVQDLDLSEPLAG